MPLKDVIVAALSRPAARVVEQPVRDLVNEALKDRGFAGPAEVAALKSELGALRTSLGALTARVDRLQAELGAEVAAALVRAGEAEARAAAAEAALRALHDAAPAAPTPVVAAPVVAAPVVVAPATPASSVASCKVADCGEAPVSMGFCRTHGLTWRAGRLPGFVGPEGLLEVEGQPFRVSDSLAGQPFKVSEKDGRLRVDGRFVTATPLP